MLLWQKEMHIPDGYLSPATCAALYAGSAPFWYTSLQKMKAAGFNAVEVYFDWGYHSPKRGVYDFSGIRDVDRLLDIARDVGIYVIARPGPYINAETDAGGFPDWLVTSAGKPRCRLEATSASVVA